MSYVLPRNCEEHLEEFVEFTKLKKFPTSPSAF